MTDLNDVVSQLAALNAAFQGSPQSQQPAWPAPTTAMVPAQPAPQQAPSMNIGALLQAMQQMSAAQAEPEAQEPPFLDEMRQMRANVASLSQQLEALAQAMQLMVRQVGMALARPPQAPPMPRPPPLPQQQQRTTTMARLPLVDPEHVRLIDDDDEQQK